MRVTRRRQGLRVRATAGTHTVLLGMDLADPAGCLGFAIHRSDHTEAEAGWLRGMKTFASVVADPPPGSDVSTREHPVQDFQWGDYSAKPGHDYTYTVVSLGGSPGALTELASTAVRVRTEVEDDGVHGVWFNRGVAGSQAFAKRFPGFVPGSDLADDHPAMVWLSRGLGEAFAAFCAEAAGPGWALHGAFYEFTWAAGLSALAAARDRGVAVSLVVHGRDRDAAGAAEDGDVTAAQARAAAGRHGLLQAITWRTAPNKNALQHNKFLVLSRNGTPVAVWTGSTNLTRGAIHGHSNVGHLVRDRRIAGAFAAEWRRLADGSSTPALRAAHEAEPVDEAVPAPPGGAVVMSPRATSSTVLSWYADLFGAARRSAHITGAFGLHEVFRTKLATAQPVVRTVLLETWPRKGAEIPRTDPNVRVSTGSHLSAPALANWAQEHLTGFNGHVRYVHTKIILIDPTTDDPVLLTGSANYSGASTTSNEENTLVLRTGNTRATSGRAMRRLADIYLTEYHRLFRHFAFRAMAQRTTLNTGTRDATALRLREDDGWAAQHYVPGSWRETQRRLFSGG